MLYSVPISIFCDIIILIKHEVDWELICQKNQTQNNRDNICKNKNK